MLEVAGRLTTNSSAFAEFSLGFESRNQCTSNYQSEQQQGQLLCNRKADRPVRFVLRFAERLTSNSSACAEASTDGSDTTHDAEAPQTTLSEDVLVLVLALLLLLLLLLFHLLMPPLSPPLSLPSACGMSLPRDNSCQTSAGLCA